MQSFCVQYNGLSQAPFDIQNTIWLLSLEVSACLTTIPTLLFILIAVWFLLWILILWKLIKGILASKYLIKLFFSWLLVFPVVKCCLWIISLGWPIVFLSSTMLSFLYLLTAIVDLDWLFTLFFLIQFNYLFYLKSYFLITNLWQELEINAPTKELNSSLSY